MDGRTKSGEWPARRVVGRVGRPHGLHGEVVVQVHTDWPEQRFVPGARFGASRADPTSHTGSGGPARAGDAGGVGPLTVESVRPHRGSLLVRFAGVITRDAARALDGTLLTVDVSELPELDDPDEYYDHQLEGLVAASPDGAVLGTVCDVIHAPASDLLVVRTARGEALVPFVREIVVRVDLAGGRLVVDPPAGLLD